MIPRFLAKLRWWRSAPSRARSYARDGRSDCEHAPSGVVVVSLQNGVGNVAGLRDRLPGCRVLGGMVPFNVISMGEGRFHRSTSGDILIEADAAGTGAQRSSPGLPIARPATSTACMGQADRQSQQRAQRAGQYTAAPAAGASRLAPVVCRPDGRRPGGDQGGRHHAGVADADPASWSRRYCGCRIDTSRHCWGGR